MMKTISPRISRYIIALMLAPSLLSGCSGIKTYKNTLANNFHIKIETDSGSMFSKLRTAVDIYRVDAECKTEYEGTVQLKNTSVEVGIPSDRLSYLVFVFAKSGFLSNSSSMMSYDAMLKPRAGYNYDVKVTYMDDIYNVVMYETRPDKKKGREIELKGLNDCKAFLKILLLEIHMILYMPLHIPDFLPFRLYAIRYNRILLNPLLIVSCGTTNIL